MKDRLPPRLMTSDAGSFAQFTIVERKPQIIRQVIEDNRYPAEIEDALQTFQEEIARRPVRPLQGSGPGIRRWNREWAAHRGRTWLELPWYFAETYFYRRLLEAVRYFEPGIWLSHDPSGAQKRIQEAEGLEWLRDRWPQLSPGTGHLAFEPLLHACLWGNRADLSNYTVEEGLRAGAAMGDEQHNVLIDHTSVVSNFLSAGVERVDIVADNAGRELMLDLLLAGFLLDEGWAGIVRFHLKNHPFFVSDSMRYDAQQTLQALTSLPAAEGLVGHMASGKLELLENEFWTSCLMFSQMPAALADDLALTDLVVIKGDVNYRRLIGDRHWPHATRLEKLAECFPSSLLAMRTLKSEIMVGLEPGQAEELAAEDPTWLINGKRGIIQLVEKTTNRREIP
ncbi:damage-control phosphatase ARMT1 family protein [Chloroflexota bacterium]